MTPHTRDTGAFAGVSELAARCKLPRPSLEKIGAALYGSRWQSELARDLGVTDRQVRRWVAGDTPLPDDMAGRLRPLVRDRINVLNAALKKIAR